MEDLNEYLFHKIKNIELMQYFDNIIKYPKDSFILGMNNISSIIKEHNLRIAISMTKLEFEKDIKILSKILYHNTCIEDKSNAEQFDDFLNEFKDKNYPEGYYKKFSSILPFDKLNNDFCQIVLDKSLLYVIASLATFELVLAKISDKFNNYAKTLNLKSILNSDRGKNNCELLLSIIFKDSNYKNNQNLDLLDVYDGINDTINIFISFFEEINSQFYFE